MLLPLCTHNMIITTYHRDPKVAQAVAAGIAYGCNLFQSSDVPPFIYITHTAIDITTPKRNIAILK